MRSKPEPPELVLDRRTRQVLDAVIRRFVSQGEPVGSRTVAKEHPEKLSPATIRNTMADLEELGLLRQPHTSAGRVPTDLAYRMFVDSLAAKLSLPPEDRRLVSDAFRQIDGNVDEMLEQVTHSLSDLSNQIGVVFRSPLDRFEMRRIEFVSLGGRRVLALFVSRTGVVSQKMIRLDDDLPQDELDRVGRYLTDSFVGLNLRSIREKLLEMMQEEKALYDKLLSHALQVGKHFVDAQGDDDAQVYVEGAFHLVGQPEFADVERMRGLFRAFEEKGRLVKLLNCCLDGDGVTVLIGSEHDDPDMDATSLVASPFFFQDRILGTLGVIGPTRMEYPRIIAMVGYIGRLLSRRLSRNEG